MEQNEEHLEANISVYYTHKRELYTESYDAMKRAIYYAKLRDLEYFGRGEESQPSVWIEIRCRSGSARRSWRGRGGRRRSREREAAGPATGAGRGHGRRSSPGKEGCWRRAGSGVEAEARTAARSPELRRPAEAGGNGGERRSGGEDGAGAGALGRRRRRRAGSRAGGGAAYGAATWRALVGRAWRRRLSSGRTGRVRRRGVEETRV